MSHFSYFLSSKTMPTTAATAAATTAATTTTTAAAVASWNQLPEIVLFQILSHLNFVDIVRFRRVCRSWSQLTYDQLLWKRVFCRHFKIAHSQPISVWNDLWELEFKRLHFKTPAVEAQCITIDAEDAHKDQVLHVSFSHNGLMFATTSKDCFVKVWESGHPCQLLYFHSLKEFKWKYTQFCQFNRDDTLLLVSGVHMGSHATSGEIAVYSLKNGEFNLQCRVYNKPYDIFGCWYDSDLLLSGNLHWLEQLVSCSLIWVNKACQELDDTRKSVISRLFRFFNDRGSTVRSLMVADVPVDDGHVVAMDTTSSSSSHPKVILDYGLSFEEVTFRLSSQRNALRTECSRKKRKSANSGIKQVQVLNFVRRGQVKTECIELSESDSDDDDDADREGASRMKRISFQKDHQLAGTSLDAQVSEDSVASSSESAPIRLDKYLIFTTGCKTYTPHQIGIKKIETIQDSRFVMAAYSGEGYRMLPDSENSESLGFDQIDHIIEMHGHIIGMALSPDHRYLYVNNRPWPHDYVIEDPLDPPPIAQEIDIHVIDLVHFKEVGVMHRSHKAYTPNDECFFIFLDVCDKYVASGAEDKHGYLWDRNYGVCLTKFQHDDVVNCVAFNPKDSSMLVTVSDDFKIKVWRSREWAAASLPSKSQEAQTSSSASSV